MTSSSQGDPYDLDRFVEAQERVYEIALAEIVRGRKQSHWMWFIFPQLEGLGHSAISRRYSIRSVDEALAYLRHPVLGPRLMECADAVMGVEGRSAQDIFGSPDDIKLQSCATLFSHVSPEPSVFGALLYRYFGGEGSARTLELLARQQR